LYRSQFTSEALDNARKLPKNVRNALKREFQRKIHQDPIACSESLTGPLENFRSFHHGDYRVIYRVFEDIKVVSVVGIGKKDEHHQTEIYKQLEILARSGELAASVLETFRSLSPGGKLKK
jgi:mRNA-degrading endonuclease RelE of RelBE toxin-antitoxin system